MDFAEQTSSWSRGSPLFTSRAVELLDAWNPGPVVGEHGTVGRSYIRDCPSISDLDRTLRKVGSSVSGPLKDGHHGGWDAAVPCRQKIAACAPGGVRPYNTLLGRVSRAHHVRRRECRDSMNVRIP